MKSHSQYVKWQVCDLMQDCGLTGINCMLRRCNPRAYQASDFHRPQSHLLPIKLWSLATGSVHKASRRVCIK